MADVAGERDGLAAGIFDHAGHLAAAPLVAAGNDDARAGLGHLFGDGPADALGRAGDDAHFAGQVEHMFSRSAVSITLGGHCTPRARGIHRQ